jgi:protein-S-isoprenylcysteine O-methyltransferase Ste14
LEVQSLLLEHKDVGRGRVLDALIGISALLIVLIARIVVEEKTWQKTLPGHTGHMKKVRYRLVPFVW